MSCQGDITDSENEDLGYLQFTSVLPNLQDWRGKFKCNCNCPTDISFCFISFCPDLPYSLYSQDKFRLVHKTDPCLKEKIKQEPALIVFPGFASPQCSQSRFRKSQFDKFASRVKLVGQAPSLDNRPIRLTQCCTQFKSFGNKTFCSKYFHII